MNCQICKTPMNVYGTYEEWAHIIEEIKDYRLPIVKQAQRHPSMQSKYFKKCPECSFICVEPLPSSETLASFYSNYHSSIGYEKKREKKINRTLRRLRNLKRYVKGGSFLDVGCNLGYAAYAASLAGFQAAGIEIDEQAVHRAGEQFPTVTFYATTLESFAAQGYTFDLVHCSEVIEHTPNVYDFARNLATVVKPGKYLYLTTPQVTSQLSKHKEKFYRWKEVTPPEHIAYFMKDNIRLLLQKVGFKNVTFFWGFKSGIRLLAQRQGE